MDKKITKISFVASTGVFFYVIAVATVSQNIDKLVGNQDSYWAPVMFLMLFVFSALVTSLLIFGYPVWLYLEHKKLDAVKLLISTVVWLFAMLILVFIIGNIL